MSPHVLLQYLAPQKTLTRIVHAATRWRWKPWKNFLIGLISRLYRIDVAEAANPDRDAYVHFNAFFTRALRPGARPLAPEPDAVLMPADGRVSQLGTIRDGLLFQAKGHDFSAAELLGDGERARPFADGVFATIYLAPRDYHRVHLPIAGTLRETLHVPGRLFSVAPGTVAAVPGLFARNERLVCHFDTAFGPMAVVLVGAMLVSGVETVWRGVEIPPYAHAVERHDYRDHEPAIAIERGGEIGRFNMGSTVIVLLPPGFVLDPGLGPEMPVRMGQRLAISPAPQPSRA
jgi:phosphatidylserine decarboxylase